MEKLKYSIQKIKYHWKKYLAITFICLAIGCLISDMIVNVYLLAASSSSPKGSQFTFVWNFFVLMYCYILIFKGNLENSVSAYRGVLDFVFMTVILLIINIFVSYINLISSCLNAQGSPAQLVITICYLCFSLFLCVMGILSYIGLKKYISGEYIDSKKILINYCIFLGCIIVTAILIIVLLSLSVGGTNVIRLLTFYLSPIAQVFAAIACLFTVLRIKD